MSWGVGGGETVADGRGLVLRVSVQKEGSERAAKPMLDPSNSQKVGATGKASERIAGSRLGPTDRPADGQIDR